MSWTAQDSAHAHASFKAHGDPTELDLVVDERGRLETLKVLRWGNPEGAAFHYVSFGAIVEEEDSFDGYTIPSRLRAGWHFGSDRFESEGEFFRAIIDDATYR